MYNFGIFLFNPCCLNFTIHLVNCFRFYNTFSYRIPSILNVTLFDVQTFRHFSFFLVLTLGVLFFICTGMWNLILKIIPPWVKIIWVNKRRLFLEIIGGRVFLLIGVLSSFVAFLLSLFAGLFLSV